MDRISVSRKELQQVANFLAEAPYKYVYEAVNWIIKTVENYEPAEEVAANGVDKQEVEDAEQPVSDVANHSVD